MPALLDTDVAIHIRNRRPEILARFADLAEIPFLSVVSQVEMEGGVYSRPDLAEERRRSLDALLAAATVLPFDAEAALAYRRIVAAAGFSRRKIPDRMIAATALAHGLTLITMNGRDFGDIAELSLEIWPSPAD